MNKTQKYIKYLFGFVLLILIFICFQISELFLFMLSALLIYLALKEYSKLFENNGIYIYKFFAFLMSIAAVYMFIYFNGVSAPFLLTGFIFPFVLTVLKNRKPYILTSIGTSCFIFFVCCGLYIIKLHNFMPDNPALLIIYFICVLTGDYSASIIGQKIKKKVFFAPEISPDKTLAGALAHIAASSVITAAASAMINLSIMQGIMYGIIISIAAQLGDLTISCFKREMKAKHSSLFFYDYGGVLDRMDAFIFSAPAAYYFYISIM